MVQVKVTDEGIEDTSEENSKGDAVEQDEVIEERPETKETPLESMKKADLLEKAREIKKTADENYDLYMRSLAEIETQLIIAVNLNFLSNFVQLDEKLTSIRKMLIGLINYLKSK